METRIGIIGLGLAGSALAERLLHGGFAVSGYDPLLKQRDMLVQVGGQARDSAGQVAQECPILLLSLPTSEVSSAVVREISPFLPHKTLLDTTTGQPEEMAKLGGELARIGCDYLDATIAGSSSQIRSGEVILMLGGPEGVVARCGNLLSALAKEWFHLGPWGSGARMKLVVNLVLGLNRAVLAEGLTFAKRIGVDPRSALEVLQASPAFSGVMETKGEKMLAGDFSPQARLSQHLKDVRLILEEARGSDLHLPLSSVHEELLARLVAAGDGDLDNSAVIKAFE